MTYVRGIATGVLLTLAGVAAIWITWSMVHRRDSSTKKANVHATPAVVEKTLSEGLLNSITLTSEAVERLALRTGNVEQRPMPRIRTYPAETMVPPGRTTLVAAPISGDLQAVEELPQPGQMVDKGKVIFHLLPLLTPEGRTTMMAAKIDADGQVKTAETQFQAAQIALTRARRVLQGEAGSQRAVDEAQAQSDLAQRTLEAAMARREVLARIVGDAETGRAGPIVIESPAKGMLRNLLALPGQSVHAGAPLFEVVDLSRMWIRVSIYAGDVDRIDTQSKVTVADLSAGPASSGWPASPVSAPPSANAIAATFDVYYELDQPKETYGPGQRMAVRIPLRSEATSLVAPWSAVVYDIYGGAWVYVQTGARSFSRERVVVQYVVDQTAVLASGPRPGMTVVVAGAAELFGTETGFSK